MRRRTTSTRSRAARAAATLMLCAAACGADETATPERGDTVTSAPRTSTTSPPPDADVGQDLSEGLFVEAVGDACTRLFEAIATMPPPDDVDDVRQQLAEGARLTRAWIDEARALEPPPELTGDYTTLLDRLEAQIDRADEFAVTSELADLPGDAPAEDATGAFETDRAMDVGKGLEDAQRALNQLLDLDCFDVSIPAEG